MAPFAHRAAMIEESAIEESHRRSRIREDIVLAVDAKGAAHLALIAELCGVGSRLVAMAIDGIPPYFRRDLSPVVLGLIREVPRVRGRMFVITSTGSRAAAQTRAARRRAAARLLARKPGERGGHKRRSATGQGRSR